MKKKQSPHLWGLFDRPAKMRLCDYPDCGKAGEYRAPKSKENLEDYYYFCLDHVREYNGSWDFFAGLAPEEIEERIRDATVWERPSWPLGDWKKREQALQDAVKRAFSDDFDHTSPPPHAADSLVPGEREALTALELTGTVDFAAIKAQYRQMVKRHHPDINGGSEEAEEKFKIINQAFAFLRKLRGCEDNEEEK